MFLNLSTRNRVREMVLKMLPSSAFALIHGSGFEFYSIISTKMLRKDREELHGLDLACFWLLKMLPSSAFAVKNMMFSFSMTYERL